MKRVNRYKNITIWSFLLLALLLASEHTRVKSDFRFEIGDPNNLHIHVPIAS